MATTTQKETSEQDAGNAKDKRRQLHVKKITWQIFSPYECKYLHNYIYT